MAAGAASRPGSCPPGSTALRELGASRIAAAIGPGARCLLLRGRRRGARRLRGPRAGRQTWPTTPTSRPSPALQLERAGVAEVHDTGLCTICAPGGLLHSHRRDGAPRRTTGSARMAELIHGLDAARVRANLEAVRAEIAAACARAGARPGGCRRARRREVRAAGRARRPRRGRDHARRREPRPGPGREGRRLRRALHVRLHRPPAEPQGQADRSRTCGSSTRSPATACSNSWPSTTRPTRACSSR